jgi:hypothetical protein
VSKQFEFHLTGTGTLDGELDADDLLAIVRSLKDVATRIGRAEADAERVGRTPRRVREVAQLTIGLAPGSTRVLVRRKGPGVAALDFELADEQAFDERFQALVESIAQDERPAWVGASLALAAADLTAALRQAAPAVVFKIDGNSPIEFATADTHRETWQTAAVPESESITFVGRLFAVNLHSHRLQVQDDVGNQIALPRVANDAEAGRFLGSYVTVTGAPERDSSGRLTQIWEAVVESAPPLPLGVGVGAPSVVPLGQILASAPGPEPGGIDLTDEEFDSFMTAVRG